MKERYELAYNRIHEISSEKNIPEVYRAYCQETAVLLTSLDQVLVLAEGDGLQAASLEQLKTWNTQFYDPLRDDNYEKFYGNPRYCTEKFGEEQGKLMAYFYSRFRDGILDAYNGDRESLLLLMELFLQVYTVLTTEEDQPRWLKETLYYYVHDYDEYYTDKGIRRLLDPSLDRLVRIVTDSDLSDEKYLYYYGENITENEIATARYISSLPREKIEKIATTYTEGYRQGFVAAGIDLSKKKTVNIRYNIGFEAVVREAIQQFEKMGLSPIISMSGNTRPMGVSTTPASKQYIYDHRFDDALTLNHAIVKEKLSHVEEAFETYKELAYTFAGPAVIEIFGEKLFAPETKSESPSYTPEQQKLSVDYRRDYMLIQNRYIREEERSFTIIAFPIPEIGSDFEEIFDETIKINSLDMELYRKVHQAIIDALDQGESVHVTGRGENETDITVMLHELKNPEKETNFENCLADVNIPVGEVFTSPVLKGTNGVLHVTKVYLNQLRYENLRMTFADGMIKDYNCSNYKEDAENRKYIKENVLHNRETLPLGEFAIGTNTTAYRMGRRYGIEAKLPILIAEKTGPHFAVGDTCYSMSEDIVLHNPDGKEIIAKENECSALRKTEIEKAYFNCHTDITIPYDELGDIVVNTRDGKEITIIREGRFVLEGTEILNDME
ncbi:MAG: aminopeptidase [Eubacterium sp.]|nr:aminopeptidase [Eubacterium sp.]